MTPGRFDLNLYRGDSYAYRFVLWQDDLQSVAVDLTGATAEAEIRERSAGVAVTVLTTTVTLPNIVEVAVDPAMYVTVPAKGVWDLQLTFADGSVQTPVAGAVTVTGDVTDSVAAPARSA